MPSVCSCQKKTDINFPENLISGPVEALFCSVLRFMSYSPLKGSYPNRNEPALPRITFYVIQGFFFVIFHKNEFEDLSGKNYVIESCHPEGKKLKASRPDGISEGLPIPGFFRLLPETQPVVRHSPEIFTKEPVDSGCLVFQGSDNFLRSRFGPAKNVKAVRPAGAGNVFRIRSDVAPKKTA